MPCSSAFYFNIASSARSDRPHPALSSFYPPRFERIVILYRLATFAAIKKSHKNKDYNFRVPTELMKV